MKNLSLLLSIIALTGVITLTILHLKSNCNTSISENSSFISNDTTSLNGSRIAFVNTDSLLIKYEYYNVLKEKLLNKQKELETEFGHKQSKFEQEAMAFQKKVQNNSFLSQQSAQAQEQEIYQKQQQLLQLKDDLSMKLMTEEQNMTAQLYDSVLNVIDIINANKKFTYIINNNMGNALLYGNANLNITDTLASILNARFKSVSAKK